MDIEKQSQDMVNETKTFLGDIVSKNNQNTLLLDRIFKAEISNNYSTKYVLYHKMIGFQGESRIFLFDCGREGYITDEEQEERKEECRGLLLNLYVAPIIRIAKIASTFFSIIDNATFACILLLLFSGTALTTDQRGIVEKIIDGDYHSSAMMIIVCSDLLHNIMHSSTRLWNLGRVDLPLVLVLYTSYFILLGVSRSDMVYWYLIFFRLCAFYASTCCDYWIEVIIYNIIMKLKQGKDFILPFSETTFRSLNMLVGRLRYPTSRLNEDQKIALKHFKGTFCCWNWTESSLRIVKKYHNEDSFQDLPSKWNHFFFYLGGFIAFVVVFLLSIVVFFLGSISYILAYLMLCLFKGLNWGIKEEILLW